MFAVLALALLASEPADEVERQYRAFLASLPVAPMTEYDRRVIDAVMPLFWLETKHWALRSPSAIFVGRIDVTIGPDGKATDVEVVEASGAPKLDRAIRSAFRNTVLPPPPKEGLRSFLFLLRPGWLRGWQHLELEILPARPPPLTEPWRCLRHD